MAELSRRALLGGGIATGAAVARLSGPLADVVSPDFREWYALARTQPEVGRVDDAWWEAHPRADHRLSPFYRHCDALYTIEARIFARALNGPGDVHTVAELGMIALFWSEKDGRSKRGPSGEYDPFELRCDPDTVPGAVAPAERAQSVLIQAAAKLYLGGLHG